MPLEELFRALKKDKCQAGTKIVLLDVAPRLPIPERDPIPFPGPSFDPDKLLIPEDVIVACSCLAGQKSYAQVDYRRGAFFDAVMRGLWGAADERKNSKITVAELRKYVDKQTQDYVAGHYAGAVQKPRWWGDTNRMAELAWPPPGLASLEKAEAALDKNELPEAETALKQVLLLHPTPLEALVKQAELLLKQKHCNEALKTCSGLEKREPNLAVIYVCRGDALLTKDDYRDAILPYTQALELDPHHADAYNSRGYSYYELNKNKEAVKDFERAKDLAIKPNPTLDKNLARAHFELAKGYLKKPQEDFEKAIKECNAAIELHKDYYEAYTTRGTAFCKLNKPELAIASFTKAIKLNPSYWPAYEHRAEAHKKIGNKEQAKKDEEKARELKMNPKR